MSDSQLEIRPLDKTPAPVGEVILAIIRPKIADTSSNPPPYIQISIGRGLFAGMVISCLVIVQFLILMIAVRTNPVDWLPMSLLTGCLFAQSQLMGLWLAISPWKLWKRFTTVTLVSGTAAWCVGNDWDFVFVCWAFISVAALVFAIPRIVFGWRIDFRPELPNSLPSWKSGGTIWGILGYVLACALLLAIMQFSDRDYFRNLGSEWIEFLSIVVSMALLNGCCTIALMCPTCRAAKAVALGVIAAFVIVLIAVNQLVTPSNTLLLIANYSLANLPFFAAVIFALRKLGWRLYQQALPTIERSAANVSFDTLPQS